LGFVARAAEKTNVRPNSGGLDTGDDPDLVRELNGDIGFPVRDEQRVALAARVLQLGSCGIGFGSGQCLSLADYVR